MSYEIDMLSSSRALIRFSEGFAPLWQQAAGFPLALSAGLSHPQTAPASETSDLPRLFSESFITKVKAEPSLEQELVRFLCSELLERLTPSRGQAQGFLPQ
jgi:hypothetical protein